MQLVGTMPLLLLLLNLCLYLTTLKCDINTQQNILSYFSLRLKTSLFISLFLLVNFFLMSFHHLFVKGHGGLVEVPQVVLQMMDYVKHHLLQHGVIANIHQDDALSSLSFIPKVKFEKSPNTVHIRTKASHVYRKYK